MAGLRDLVLDMWAQLNHKAAMTDPMRAGLAPSWAGPDHRRRITAYHVLDAYLENSSRHHLRTLDDVERGEYREYGDCQLLVDRVVAGVLGDTFTVAVEGADDEIPDAPPLPDPLEPLPEGADETAQRVHALQAERHQMLVDEAIADWETAWRAQPGLRTQQEQLRQWADDELLEQQVWLGEHDATGLGDGVYVLGWDAAAGRVTLQVYDPRTYFPVLDDAAFRLGYPLKVHLAWQEERPGPSGSMLQWVRRITYELRQLVDDEGRPAPRANQWGSESTHACYLTDAEWPLQDAGGNWIIDALAPQRAKYLVHPDGTEVRDLDLLIDFIPVVHVPGLPSGREHFGRSILARVLQLLDDLQSTDTDLQAAAALAGTPMVGLSGNAALGENLVVEPGAVFGLGANGRMDVLDMGPPVEALRHVDADLLERLSINIQIPGEVLGRVDDTGPESGFARLLKLGPFSSLVGVLRLVRTHKYRLLLKFVQRLHQAGGVWGPGPTADARLVFGAFLPADQKAVVETVVALVGGGLLSRESALRALVEVGIDIDDIGAELERLQVEDFEAALLLLDVTGDEELVRRRLRLPGEGPRPEPPSPPEPNLPPAP